MHDGHDWVGASLTACMYGHLALVGRHWGLRGRVVLVQPHPLRWPGRPAGGAAETVIPGAPGGAGGGQALLAGWIRSPLAQAMPGAVDPSLEPRPPPAALVAALRHAGGVGRQLLCAWGCGAHVCLCMSW